MLSVEDRRKIRKLEIVTSRLVEEFVAGQYSSLFKGRGVEFSEVREYQPGDDVRSIDWNVTARFGRPFVKQNVEERELTVLLAVDLSASLDFGSCGRTKREVVSELAALLAMSALNNDHKVGLLGFTDRVELFVPPRKGRRHILRIIREILDSSRQSTGTDLRAALRYLNSVQHRRAVLFLFSDFLGLTSTDGSNTWQALERDLRVTCMHHDVSVMRVYDQRESQMPNVGYVRLRDLETGEVAVANTSSARFRQAYAQIAQQRTYQLRDCLDRVGVDYAELSTQEQSVRALVKFLQDKKARSRYAKVR